MSELPGYPWEARRHEGMAFIDEGTGDPVLLLHGEPTWSYLYRRVIPPLAETARVVAPDFYGFGRSDKPTDQAWYSYDRHVASIHALVEALDLRRITVVVQDWGGPIGMRVATEAPDRFDRLVVLNTAIGAGRMPEVWLRFRELMRHDRHRRAAVAPCADLLRTTRRRGRARGVRLALPGRGLEGRRRRVPRASCRPSRSTRTRRRCGRCATR